MRFVTFVSLIVFSSAAIADEVFYCEYTASGEVNNGQLFEYQQFTGKKFKMKITQPVGIGSMIEFSEAAMLPGNYKIRDCWGKCTTKFIASNDYHYHDTILQFIEAKILQVASVKGHTTLAKEAICEKF